MSNPEYYLAKATEMRELASSVHDPLMRHRFLVLAGQYEALASSASDGTVEAEPQLRRFAV